ncbi:hypothetical protein FLA_4956 [Filimonas lacunae]|nr:hypothetical protein FLA_4956 [Filimonas lacunae]
MGTAPEKFASIVRINAALNTWSRYTSLAEICQENPYFDQAHFIKGLRQYGGYS